MKTYDILNAGPRNRFMVSGRIVHNCTGDGPQPLNLPKAGPPVVRCGYDGKTRFEKGCGHHHAVTLAQCPWCGVYGPPRKAVEWNILCAEDALAVMESRSVLVVEQFFGNALLTVAGCLRSLYIASNGNHLVGSDFTAIEAVGAACLANEQWRIDVFRSKADIYLYSIARSMGIDVQELIDYKTHTGQHHKLRQAGKITELALGFLGWIGALKSMAKQLGIEISDDDEELKQQIIAWRKASPAIVELAGGQTRDFGRTTEYFGMEGAAVMAMLHHGERQYVTRLDGGYSGLSYIYSGHTLYLTFPNGRSLAYQFPELSESGTWRGFTLSFMGWNSNPKMGPMGWVRMPMYAGRCLENADQGYCRDIQRRAILNNEAAGIPIVLHIYDECVGDVPLHRTVEELEAQMLGVPAEVATWPIEAAGGWSGRHYRKA